MSKMYCALFRLCVLITLISLASGNFSEVIKKVDASHIRKILEDLRLRFCYNDPNGLPQLEPLILKEENPINVENTFGSLKGYFRNTQISGLSNFVIEDIAFHVAGFEFDISISIPKLIATGEYAAKGKFAMFLSVDGEDKYTLELNGARLRVKGSIQADQDVMSLKVTTVESSIETVQSDFKGLAQDEESNSFLNNLVTELTPQYFGEYVHPFIKEAVTDSIEKAAADYLKGDKALDLIDIITGETSLFPPLHEEHACKITSL